MSLSLARKIMAGILMLLLGVASCQVTFAQDDIVHIVKGIVKHVDRDGRTIIVKADDGIEHTVKWTDKTTWEGIKHSDRGVKEGSKVALKYTEKAGEKTAVGIKGIGKDVRKAAD